MKKTEISKYEKRGRVRWGNQDNHYIGFLGQQRWQITDKGNMVVLIENGLHMI